MGNYSSTEIEVFKGIVSAAGSDTHSLETQTPNNNHDEVWHHLSETLQEPNLFSLKFLHNITETDGEPSEPKTDAPSKPEVSPSPEVSSASSNSSSPTVSSLVSVLRSSDSSSSHPKPHLAAPTLQKLSVALQDMREELELLKTQHKREIKLLMNELDEEKKMRLSLQVEVEHLKKHMSK